MLFPDILFSAFLDEIIDTLSPEGNLLVGHHELWKIDNYEDGFNFDPAHHPLTRRKIERLNELLVN